MSPILDTYENRLSDILDTRAVYCYWQFSPSPNACDADQIFFIIALILHIPRLETGLHFTKLIPTFILNSISWKY